MESSLRATNGSEAIQEVAGDYLDGFVPRHDLLG